MKKAKVLFFLLFAITTIDAQKAPDFTITDYNGTKHTLYEDYLDKDMVVMIKIMFVACPPCNLVAPQIQDLYEFFGEGQDDVQFIELSNKTWDNNAAVKGFAEKHSLTFPGAGTDGGALSAVDPYVSGQFGTFLGTPCFIVISPDGSVDFNIPLQNLKSTIEQALDGGSNGCSNSFGGALSTPSTTGAQVFLRSDIVGSREYELEVDNNEYHYNCEFTFPPQASDYYLTVEEDGKDIEGLSVKDIVIILRHLLGKELFTSTEEKIAADYNGNGVISVRDISEMRKLVIGTFGENLFQNSWTYWHESTDFSQDSSGIIIPDLIQQIPLMMVVDSVVSGDFIGVKVGDLSGDINTFFKKNATRSPQQLHLQYQDSWIQAGGTTTIDVFPTSKVSLSGVQLEVISSSPISFQFPNGWDEAHHTNSYGIRCMAYRFEAEEYDIGNPLLQIQLTADHSGYVSEMLQFSKAFSAEATNGRDDYTLSLSPSQLLEEVPVQITPNPATERLIHISSPTKEISSVEILWNTGQGLRRWSLNKRPSFTVQLPEQPGLYLIRLRFVDGTVQTQKVIKI